MPPLIIGGAIAAAGAIGGAAIGANAAGNAASTQANAANNAAQLQYQSGQNALDFNKQVFGTEQANAAPFIQAGQGAVNNLSSLLGISTPSNSPVASPAPSFGLPNNSLTPGVRPPAAGQSLSMQDGSVPAAQPNALGFIGVRGSTASVPGGGPPNINPPAGGIGAGPNAPITSPNLTTQWSTPFTPPTAQQAAATPGEQFMYNQGLQALQNSAAAKGNLLSGSTLKGLEQYGQGLASTNYQQAYNNALEQYQQNYNIFQQNQGNQFNRLATLAGLGQTGVGQLNSAGQSAAANNSNVLLGTAGQIGQNINNAGAATASGYINSANAYGGALSNLGNLGQLLALNSVAKSGSGNSLLDTTEGGPDFRVNMGIPLAANNLRIPEQQNPIDTYAKLIQLRGMQQNQALQSQLGQQQIQSEQLENQQRQYQVEQTQAINSAYHDALKPDANGMPQIDQSALTKSLAASGHGSAIPSILENLTKWQKTNADLQETQSKLQSSARDSLGYLGQAIQKSNYDPNLADLIIQQRLSIPGVPPQEAQQLQQIRQIIQQKPETLKVIADNLVNQSPGAQKTGAETTTAEARKQAAQTGATALQQRLPGGQLYPPTLAGQEAQARMGASNSPEAIAGAARKAGAEASARVSAENSPTAIQGAANKAVAVQKATQGLLEGPAKDMAAENYFQSGQLPAGARSPGMISSIINRAAELHPGGNLAGNKAAFEANKASYKNVTETLDTLSAFENAGLNNLKMFTDAAQKIPDTGVPWLNTPVRLLNEKMMGSPDQAAAVATGQVALREIARVTGNPKLTGQLSDTARHEVESLIPANATLPQIKRVADILQQDMANVHEGLANQKADIARRLGTGGQSEQPNVPRGTSGGPAGKKSIRFEDLP